MSGPADRTTKVLLLAIALGLWANAAMPLFRPASVAAQDMSTVEQLLRSISSAIGYVDSKVGSLDSDLSRLDSKVGRIESDVDDIEDGTCSNRRLCGP